MNGIARIDKVLSFGHTLVAKKNNKIIFIYEEIIFCSILGVVIGKPQLADYIPRATRIYTNHIMDVEYRVGRKGD